MGDNNDGNENGSLLKQVAKEGIKEGIKGAWNKLPIAVKLKIIGIAALVIVGIIIIMAIIGSFNFGIMSYADPDVSAEDKKELEDNWRDLCSYEKCSDKTLENQKKFYEELNKQNLDKKQKYILVTTIFYEYDIDEIIGGKAYDADLDEIEETDNSEDGFKKERATIKKLAKHFKSGENDNHSYYEFLKTSDFFDKRENIKIYFKDYATAHQKSVNNLTETEKQEVRLTICNNIKEIVADYMNEEKDEYIVVVPSSTGYWWPIGSKETTSENGKLFAKGEPEFVYISSYFGPRVHPVTGVQSYHGGIDIPGTANSTNVIATLSGEVKEINNSCNSISTTESDKYCGGSFGNYIKIQDTKGNVNIYAHLYRNSLRVGVGDVVSQGQVIAKVGASGMSTGPHLHFEIRVDNNRVNPLDYVDSQNPRPTGSADDFNFNNTVYSESEFVAIVNNYYSQDDVCNSYNSNYTSRCNDLKKDILYGDGASIAYRVASDNQVNPELIFPRMMLEGYSPGVGHNYFGYACGNTYSGFSCTNGFTSFESAMAAFFKYASDYTTLFDMMATYAYLGKYWYADVEGGSAFGGCYYAKYIYPNGIPKRVQEACNQTTCTPTNNEGCVETTQEDLDAYTNYQVRRMSEVRKKIFK